MQCNIDSKGKAIRLTAGMVVSVIALVVLGLGLLNVLTGTWVWVLGAVMLAAALFMIYEGWSGWCVVRAMGFKTPV